MRREEKIYGHNLNEVYDLDEMPFDQDGMHATGRAMLVPEWGITDTRTCEHGWRVSELCEYFAGGFCGETCWIA